MIREIEKYTNLIFDLDGTILDSKGDVKYYLEKTFRDFNLLFNEELLVIGPTLKQIIKIIVPEIDEALCSRVADCFRIYYNRSDFEHTFLYNHVDKLIEESYNKQKKLFIATNKPMLSTNLILKKFNLSRYFSIVLTPDFFPERFIQKEEMIRYIMGHYQLINSETIMIGDAKSDIQAGQACQIDTAAHLSGYTSKSELLSIGPTFAFDKYSDL